MTTKKPKTKKTAAPKKKRAAASRSPKKRKDSPKKGKAELPPIPPPLPKDPTNPEPVDSKPKASRPRHVIAAADRAEARARGEALVYSGPLTVDVVMPDGLGALAPPMSEDTAGLTPKEKFKAAGGRPTIRTDELVKQILFRIMCGESVRQICSDPEMPNRSTIYDWLASDEGFSDQYARAHEVAADEVFDEIIEIADKCPPDKGFVAAANIQINARKWVVARKVPKKYGDKVDVNINGQISRPIEESDTPEEAAAKYAESRNID